MPMTGEKPASKSLTLQAVLGTIVFVGYQFAAQHFGLPVVPEGVYEALVSMGLVIAGVGRVRAKDTIGKGK